MPSKQHKAREPQPMDTEFAAASKMLYAGRAAKLPKAKLPKKRANRKGILGR